MITGGGFHRFVDGNIGEDRKQARRHHQPLPPDLVRKRAEHSEERHAGQKSDRNDDAGGLRIHLQNRLEIKQSVELAGIPNNALAGGRPEQRDQHPLQVLPFSKGVLKRLDGSHACTLDLAEDRRFLHLQANVQGYGDQDD